VINLAAGIFRRKPFGLLVVNCGGGQNQHAQTWIIVVIPLSVYTGLNLFLRVCASFIYDVGIIIGGKSAELEPSNQVNRLAS
jgi:hypothetical protein